MKYLLPFHVLQLPRLLPHRYQCYQLLMFPSRIVYEFAITSLDCIYAVLLVWPLGPWHPYSSNAWWSLTASSALSEVLTAEWWLWWMWACSPWSSLTKIPVFTVILPTPPPTHTLCWYSFLRVDLSLLWEGRGQLSDSQNRGRIWGWLTPCQTITRSSKFYSILHSHFQTVLVPPVPESLESCSINWVASWLPLWLKIQLSQ